MKRIVIIVLLLTVNTVIAQQDAFFTTYNYNLNSINPAFSMGNGGSLRSGLINRAQWLGFEDAPNTSEFFMHYAFTQNTEAAITLQHDQLGNLLKETTVSIDYSRNLFINPYSYFSLGIKASVTMFDSNFGGLALETGDFTTDPNFLENPKNIFPNVGVGAFWYDEDYNYYLGLSIPNLFSSKYFNVDKDTYKYKLENQHIYITAGTLYEIVDDITTKPSILLRYTSGNPITLDVNNMVQFYDKFEVGLSYSVGVSATALATIKFKDNFQYNIS